MNSLLINLFVLAGKQLIRHRTRSILTILGVAAGMFLFTTVETMQASLQKATVANAKDTTLVVYQENRFCPSTSRLPEYYANEIENIEGVSRVIPTQIMVNNCGTSLDVVVFRGVPKDSFLNFSPNLKLEDGSYEQWIKQEDGALIGKNLAQRRFLSVGDRFDAAGVNVSVSGIISSEEASQDDNVAFVNLPFLQQASQIGLGTVTQFDVKVHEAQQIEYVSSKIDDCFSSNSIPTNTRPEKAFFANTARELIEFIRFSRWLGLAAVAAVIGLLANTILLTIRGKISEHAVLKTLGFNHIMISWMVLSEGIILSFSGGILGVSAGIVFLHQQSITIGNEGLALAFIPTPSVLLIGLGSSIILGLFAGIYPAWQAGSSSITENLRVA